MKKYYVHISSVTGNTKKLAQHLLNHLPIQYEFIDLHKSQPLIDEYVILFFWCRRSNMDPLTLKVLSNLRNCHIIAMGTMGSYPDSKYGSHVRELVEESIRTDNFFDGIYLCRGAIDPVRTMKRRNLPVTSPHYLDDASYERHLSSRGHPDEKDLAQALSFFYQYL